MSDPLPSDPRHLELVGQTLGNYRLLHRLGRGGMAEVYLAEQTSLQRQVALKVLRRDLAQQDDYVKRFHNEARAVAALVHSNIVQIYEVGCDQGVHFIAQEYVPGLNLKQLVTRNGPLEISRAVSILRQVAAALGKAGQRNIVHRDIKPENILLSPTGEVKVADFGLARVMDTQSVDLTQAGLTVGTPLYMSPEQVEGKSLDLRSDLYACGATAFFMLVGRPPFQGDTPLSVAIQHLQSVPPPLQDLRPDAPHELCAIVDRLLAKKPQERYSSAVDLLRDLRALPSSHWDHDLQLDDGTSSNDLEAAPESTLDATRELQAIMQTQAMIRVRSKARWAWPLGIAMSLVFGALLAGLTWSGSLLYVSPAEADSVERKLNASDQYWHALELNTEEAYLSVSKFHRPDQSYTNRHYACRADQQLASLYIQNNQLDRALEIYQRLAQQESEEFLAAGFAGQAIVHDLRGESSLARSAVSKAMRLRSRLEPQMGANLDRIKAKIEGVQGSS